MVSYLMTVLLAVSAPFATEAVDAYFSANCDNLGTLFRSNDGGLTFSTLVSESGWSSWGTTLYQTLTNVDSNTVIRAACRDVGGVGGFIGQVVVNAVAYPTLNPLSMSKWTVDSTDPLTYNANGGGAWTSASSSLDLAANWVWNSAVYNTMTFEVDFAMIIDICGDWGALVVIGHACQCQSECTGDFCNTAAFVAARLDTSETTDDLCPDADAATCCCSCPNCEEQGYNYIPF